MSFLKWGLAIRRESKTTLAPNGSCGSTPNVPYQIKNFGKADGCGNEIHFLKFCVVLLWHMEVVVEMEKRKKKKKKKKTD